MNDKNDSVRPLRILHVEDSPQDVEIIRERLLAAGFSLHIDWACNEEQYTNFLCNCAYDLVLADYRLPAFNAPAALRLLQSLCPGVPFICVSGAIGEENAVELLKQGATDYVLKSRLDKLPLAMQRALDEVRERKARQLADEELRVLHKTLEARVNEMVADLRRKDQTLIQQSRLAAMGEMIGNIAHQWRQPLNNVALIIQNIQMQYDSGTLTSEEMGNDIHEAMEVLLQMSSKIDDLRNFFRVDKERQGFFVSKVVGRTLELVSPNLGSHKIKVEIESDDEVAATGYQNEYAQVLINIISNAREAAIERNIPLPRIMIRIASENGRSVVTVRDNCGGIPDDILPKIFDPYFTTRGPDRGTGIGLYMSKVIIEQNMAGKLTARNVDGGAEFRVEV
ncbi:MAG: ATP-binding protein [Desulfuromonadaceae bacterium]|nr:ATP-binding protein [Desulfuromonadaceae bacterium]MDD2850103.1 ATP-binding protein [Desulfuromonadaceae bacterium]MDD4130350.1 ATP-binding protein [Desulfuromonadaceae bacterium]